MSTPLFQREVDEFMDAQFINLQAQVQVGDYGDHNTIVATRGIACISRPKEYVLPLLYKICHSQYHFFYRVADRIVTESEALALQANLSICCFPL